MSKIKTKHMVRRIMQNATKAKIQKINEQIEKLKQQQAKLGQTFERKIVSLIKNQNGFSHDFEILYGAIHETLIKLNHKETKKEDLDIYKKTGSKLLNKSKTKPVTIAALSEKTEQAKK